MLLFLKFWSNIWYWRVALQKVSTGLKNSTLFDATVQFFKLGEAILYTRKKMSLMMIMMMMMMHFFIFLLTSERRLALFPGGAIVRDAHHCKSPTCREQDLNLRWTYVEWSCTVVITNTSRHHNCLNLNIHTCKYNFKASF